MPLGAVPAPEPRVVVEPQRIGRFEVLSTLGEGGMGTVYRVRDPRRGDELALKLLGGASRSCDALRLRREFRAIRRLDHPGIVRVYELGVTDDARDFYTMEIVRGTNVAAYLARRAAAGAARVDLTLPLAAQVAEALSYLHAQRLVHRDLKPDNILIGDDGTAKLVDFGLAQDLARPASRLTREDAVMGTALYVSPEQARGLQVDNRSDLYSLGVLLYEMLSGSPPFRDKSAMTVLYKHVHDPPPALTGVPRALEALVMRLLAKNPFDRPRSASEVVCALRAMIETRGAGSHARELGDTVELTVEESVRALGEPRLVGRHGVMQEIARAVCDLRRGEANGGLVVIEGALGRGKTRLLREIAALPPLADAWLHQMRLHRDDSRVPYGGCASLLTAVARELTGEDERADARTLRCAAGTASDSGDVRPPGGVVSAALVGGLRRIARERSVVLLVDDGQWLDAASEQLIAAIAELASEERLLVFVTRDELPPQSRAPMRVLEQTARRSVTLDPLDRRAVGQMISGMLGADQVPDSLTDRVAAESAGNPLLVQEIIKVLVERRCLGWSARGWVLDENEDVSTPSARRSGDVPATLADAAARRLQRLDDDARDVLACAAVMGRELSFRRLEAVTGLAEEALFDVVNDLIRHDLLQPAATSSESARIYRASDDGVDSADAAARSAGSERYAFTSAVFPGAVLSAMSPARRAALHRRLAEAIERLAEHEPRGSVLFELAHHYDEAGDAERALDYCRRSAELAMCRHDPRSALSFYERASELALASEAPRDVPRSLDIARAACLAQLRDCDAALELARPLLDGATCALERASLHETIGDAQIGRGNYEAGINSLLSGLAVLGERMPRGVLGVIFGLLAATWNGFVRRVSAGVLRLLGRDTRLSDGDALRRRLYQELIPLFAITPHQYHRLSFIVVGARLVALSGGGNDLDRADAYFMSSMKEILLFGALPFRVRRLVRKGVRLEARLSDPMARARLCVYRGWLALNGGMFAQATAELEHGVEAAELTGDRYAAAIGTRVLLETLAYMGDFEATARHSPRAVQYGTSAGVYGIAAQVFFIDGYWRAFRGDLERARRAIARGEALQQHESNLMAAYYYRLSHMTYAIWDADYDAAIAHAKAAIERCRGCGQNLKGATYTMLAKAQLFSSDFEGAAATMNAVGRYARRMPMIGGLHQLICAHVSITRGQRGRAVQQLRRAFELFGRCPAAMWQAWSLMLLARLEGDDAKYAEACAMAEKLGGLHMLEATDRILLRPLVEGRPCPERLPGCAMAQPGERSAWP
ncbi:MAG: protein kinase [Myxococcales bacterium]|nr:protein kinase [Myxococcales bacterium]